MMVISTPWRAVLDSDSTFPIGILLQVHQLGAIAHYQVLIATVILIGTYTLIITEALQRTLCAMVII